MDNMEMEAIKRAQEMHRGARYSQPTVKSPPQEPPKREEEPQKEDGKHLLPSVPLDTSKLFEDKEKLLILLLILILTSEKNSDPTLILALLYVII